MTVPSIRMEPNGPYVVTGPMTVADADGNEIRVDFVSRPSFLPEPAQER